MVGAPSASKWAKEESNSGHCKGAEKRRGWRAKLTEASDERRKFRQVDHGEHRDFDWRDGGSESEQRPPVVLLSDPARNKHL